MSEQQRYLTPEVWQRLQSQHGTADVARMMREAGIPLDAALQIVRFAKCAAQLPVLVRVPKGGVQ